MRSAIYRILLLGLLMTSLFITTSCNSEDAENLIDNSNISDPADTEDAVEDDSPVISDPDPLDTGALIIDHSSTDLSFVPLEWIEEAKDVLHIAYGHTSHGSQITTGMSGLVNFAGAPHGGSTYTYNSGGSNGALDLRDRPFAGASDLGNPDRTAWAEATRNYLDSHPEINVIIWSWCGQADGTEEQINTYLDLMSDLEEDYPDVMFVYMTGHTNGTGLDGNLHQRNLQIRRFCETNGKILYDFEDIESYDPDGEYFGDLNVTDTCAYNGGNWAIEWQNSHTEGVDWYNCSSAHSEPLNANRKAYAAWWLWARLAGWDGN
ncbi:MAG: hypothetical protein JXL81_07260 [Deltaproteobacteria bacterium]|nr:hypothetical protein [Deltaproteobacteria bacterium]